MSVDLTSEDEQNGKSDGNQEVIAGYKTVEEFTKDGFKVLMESIRNSNALPNGRDWNYYKAFEAFGDIMNKEGNRIQRLMNTILRVQDIGGNIRNKLLDEKVELIVEANDVILEKVANNIDEMNGIKKNMTAPVEIQTVSAHIPINSSWNRVTNATFSVSNDLTIQKKSHSVNSIRLLTAKNIIRPQKFFKDKIDNSNRPWEPRITDKPNSLKPLAVFLEEYENGEEFSHPYQFELEFFQPPDSQLQNEKPIPPKPISETPLIEISEPQQLNELVETLRNVDMFAVDLEHHSYRTFMGITCLMQISTQDSDYIIDTLALRDKLFILNEVFTKSSILKIFHGADMDIQWLQRDLSLYVVNMFDTHQAAKLLEYPSLSLSFLMNKFCELMPNKQFQLADWRIRPLPDELKNYAREDTHYLAYIYQMMKKELFKKGNGSDNFLRSVFQQSSQVCLKRYRKPILREDTHLEFYRKCKRLFDNRQLYALKLLYKWRDELSRQEDESTGYVLPNHMLLQISEALPREMQGILACCNPTPPLVKAHLLELHHIILKARDQPLEKAILKEDNRSRGSTLQFTKVNMDSPLHCPHDLSHSREFRDDLPTILNGKIDNETIPSVKFEKLESRYSIFNISGAALTNNEASEARELKILTPYQRYKLAKTFIRAEDELAAETLSETAKCTEKEAKTFETQRMVKECSNRDAKTVERSDEERIASIRDHYLELVRKSEREVVLSQEDDNTRNSETASTKKRKRNSSVPDDTFYDDKNDGDELDSENPKPSVFTRIGPKRTSSEAFSEECYPEISYNKRSRPDGSSQNRGNKKKNRFKRRNPRNNDFVRENIQNPQNNFTDRPLNQGQNNSNCEQTGQHSTNNKKFKNKNKNKQKFKKNQNKFQSKTDVPSSVNDVNDKTGNADKNKSNFTPYDYSAVDYREFQGGAGVAHKPQQFKTNFKGRGKGRRGNRGNKSSMFGNDRGRGRRGR